MNHWLSTAPFGVLWLTWLAYWIVAARNVKATRRREPFMTRLGQIALMVLVAALLAFRHQPAHWLEERFLPPTMVAYWLGLIMVAGGLAVAVWARGYLGRNWSGAVTVKQDHELVRGGPYRFVRHPIYSGLLLAILGTAIAFGQWRGLLAFGSITVALWLKLKTEEHFMSETFPDEYARYRAEVPALVPFIGRPRPADRVSG